MLLLPGDEMATKKSRHAHEQRVRETECLVLSGVPTEISDRASRSIWGVPGQRPQSLSVRRKCSHVIGQTSVVQGSLESEIAKATPQGPRQRAGGAVPQAEIKEPLAA